MPDSLRDQIQASLGTAYTLERELGGGGMSRVFVVDETRLRRKLVVKVLSPELAAGVSAERFQREIELAASLQQANIVPLLAVGETDGLPYYTMPFVDGLSLRARLERNGALPAAEAISVLRDVARALAYAHDHGVVHRDIKPENILLSGDAAVVTDFGIAKALSASRTTAPGGTLTQVGTSIGTPAYMAPEQAAGDPATDHRADLYALGCVAYEMLTGAAPFAGRPMHQLHAAHMMETPAPVEKARPDVPRALAVLVRRCLEKDPARRPQSAREVLDTLNATGSGIAVGGRESLVGERRRGATVLGATAFALIVAAALGGWFVRARGASSDGASGAEHSIAVLPFQNLGDSADAYFADGVTDAVRGKLGELKGVRVIARASSTQYQGSTKTPQQIGAELGVEYLLTATVRWQKGGGAGGPNRVQVRPELIAVRDASSKWQEPFDAALTDVFQVQADIAGKVASALDVALGDSAKRALAVAPTDNLAAYDAYLRGQAATQSGATADPTSLRRALSALEQAVKLDPAFALAWAQLALVRSNLYTNSTPSAALAQSTKEAVDRVVALAPGSAEAQLALGVYYRTLENDIPRALATYEAGLRVAPDHVRLLANAVSAEQSMGRWEAALAHAKRARALDPRAVNVAQRIVSLLTALRRYPEAQATADTLLALAPRSLQSILYRVMISLAQGDLPGARAVMHASSQVVGRSEMLAYLATYYDLYWIMDNAEQQTVLGLPPSAFDDDRASWALVRAQIYGLRGDGARARQYADSSQLAFSEQLRAAPDDHQLHVLRGLALAYQGRKAEAIEEGMHGTTLKPLSRDAVLGAYDLHQLARIYLLVGEREKALAALETLLGMPYYLSPAWLRIDPNFAPLRGDPRFEALAAGH